MFENIDLAGARDLRSTLKSIVTAILRDDPEFAATWRVYRARVTTAPNGSVCGVLIVGQTQSIDLPYSTAVSDCAVGDLVIVGAVGGNLSNAVVWQKYDYTWSGGGGGGGGVTSLGGQTGAITLGNNLSMNGQQLETGCSVVVANPTLAGTEAALGGLEVNGTKYKIPSDLTFSNVSVLSTDFVSDSTYTDYGYKAAIPLSGVTSAYFPVVVFSPTDAESGNYAPIAETYNGGVYIYAKVDTAITIPTIHCVQ